MILYDLTCPDEHRFDSWFRNSAAADKLIKAGQVNCPVCGSKKVHKALQAPRIAKASPSEVAAADEKGELAAAMEKVATSYNNLRESIEKNYEHVGNKFPEEARKIHYGETKKRAIYGDASQKETADLHDEGIEVHQIPWPRRTDS